MLGPIKDVDETQEEDAGKTFTEEDLKLFLTHIAAVSRDLKAERLAGGE